MSDGDAASPQQPDRFSASRNSVKMSILAHSLMLFTKILDYLPLHLAYSQLLG